jgi:adenylate cyclase class 2
LIAYERADQAGPRESRYRLVEIADGSEIKAALSDALGITAVVAKQRRLFLWEGVRIHLDQVDGLGSFVEFEAIVGDGPADLERAEGRIDELRREFGLDDDCLVASSYSDLTIAS